jgi:hypothetical protein
MKALSFRCQWSNRSLPLRPDIKDPGREQYYCERNSKDHRVPDSHAVRTGSRAANTGWRALRRRTRQCAGVTLSSNGNSSSVARGLKHRACEWGAPFQSAPELQWQRHEDHNDENVNRRTDLARKQSDQHTAQQTPGSELEFWPLTERTLTCIRKRPVPGTRGEQPVPR